MERSAVLPVVQLTLILMLTVAALGHAMIEAGYVTISFPAHSHTEKERELVAAIEAAMTQEIIGSLPPSPHLPWCRVRSGLVFRAPPEWMESPTRHEFEDWQIVSRPSD